MILLFFVCFIGLRAWERLFYPQILSEDGRVFLSEAFANGWHTLFQPYAGYYHTLPRILALVSTLGSVLWIPWILTWTCVFIFCLLLERICHNDYSQLFETPTERFCWALCLSFTPGLFEVLGNPTNIHWILSLYLALLALRNSEAPLLKRDFILGTLAVMSGGECISLLPLYIARLYMRKTKTELYFSILIFVFAMLNLFGRESGPGLDSHFLKQLPSGLHYLWNNWFLLQPLLGDDATEYLGHNLAPLYWGLSLSLTLLLCARLWLRRKTPPNILFLFFMIGSLGTLLMLWTARAESFGIFAQITRDAGYSRSRYSFLIGPAAILFHLYIWPQVFPSMTAQKWTLFFAGITLVFSSHRFVIGAHPPLHPTWKERLDSLSNEACRQPTVSIPVWPREWSMNLPTSKLKKLCP